MREIKFKCLLQHPTEDKRTAWYYYGINEKPILLPNQEWITPDLQYIGLTDKNKKEIYEGDIVFTSTPVYPEGTNVVVEWVDSGWQPFILEDDLGSGECEVIGNVHENPELLKELE